MLSKDTKEHRWLRWLIYRYVTVAHFLVYGTVSKSASVKSMFFTSQLLAVGLITDAEKMALDASCNKKTTSILWLSQLFNHGKVNHSWYFMFLAH